MKKWLTLFFLVLYVCLETVAWAKPQIPPVPSGSIYVQDYAGVLSGTTKAKINKMGTDLAAQTKAQVSVVTITSLQGEDIQDYSLALLREWKLGDKTLNNGVLLLVVTGAKQSRIEVGYGLEGALNDAKTGTIQDEYMLPYFRKGDYEQGILQGYQVLIQTVGAEYGLTGTQAIGPPEKQSGKHDKAAKGGAAVAAENWWETLPWWLQAIAVIVLLCLLAVDWIFFGGNITLLILSLLRFRGGGGGGSSGGGGSGGGGGSSRKW